MRLIESGLVKYFSNKNIVLEIDEVKKLEPFLNKSGISKTKIRNIEIVSLKGKIVDNQLLMIKDKDNKVYFRYSLINNNSIERWKSVKKKMYTSKILELLEFDNYLSNSFYRFNKSIVKYLKDYRNYLYESMENDLAINNSLSSYIGNGIYNKFINSKKKNIR